MDYGWMSHALLALVGIMTAGTLIASIGAMWSLGRASTYDK